MNQRLYHLFYLSLFVFTSLTLGAQNLTINEMVSSNSKFFDGFNQTPDWIELYNAGPAMNLEGYALTDVADSLQKWTFPSIWLDSASTILVFASGKNLRTQTFYNTVVNQGDNWQYTVGDSNIPIDWYKGDFDYSSWQSGPSGFGYGDNDDATTLPDYTLSVFAIKKITITDVNKITDLLLHCDYDDGFIAYLNGVEIARSGIGIVGTPVDYAATASVTIEPKMIQNLPPDKYQIANFASIIKNGENILAIQAHNASTSSSDLSLIPFLTFGYNYADDAFTTPEIFGLKNTALHTNFKINADGETIYLANPSGEIIDQIDSIALPFDISYGHQPDGTGNMFYFAEPTPGKSNTTKAYSAFAENLISASLSSGIYKTAQQLTLTATGNNPIYYTTDGTEPSASSNLYSEPINLDHTTVIKATSVSSDLLPGRPFIASYIIESRTLSLPVVSLSTDPYNLWDYYYGIYVFGPNAESGYPFFGANFWQDWERPVHFEYFNELGELVVKEHAGVNVFGNWSQANGLQDLSSDPKISQKSLAITARKEYGSNSFDYAFFKEKPQITKFKSIVLRNSGNDWNSTAFRDAMQTTLTEGTGIDKQAYQPTIVYLNGEYWGILNLREKLNEHYIEDNHGIKAEKVDILQGNNEVLSGSNTHYLQMLTFISNNSLANDANYQQVSKMMDVVNFMEYEIAEIYLDNQDWPGNNIKYWREQSELGVWRWFLFDTDFGFGYYGSASNNTLEFALNPYGSDWPNPPWSTFLLRNLIKNTSFQNDFINRFADRLNTNYLPKQVSYVIDSLAKNIRTEMPWHIDRWNHIWDWEGNVKAMKNFGNARPAYLREHIQSQFNLTGQFNLTININDLEMGYVQVNSIEINNAKWTGIYFKGVPITITAIPKPGYRFKEWINSAEVSAQIKQAFTTNKLITAVFEPDDNLYNPIVINEINYNSAPEHATDDWVELFNTTNLSLDLSNWYLTDINAGNKYLFPQGTQIAPKGFLVVCQSKNKLKSMETNAFSTIGDFDFGFGADYDAIKLFNQSGNLIDSVYYESENPWPNSPNGNGYTLSLIDPYNDNLPYYRWEASKTVYGTPGRQNDNYNGTSIPETELAELDYNLNVYPNPAISYFNISFELPTSADVTINITDLKGSLLFQKEYGQLMAGGHNFEWSTNFNHNGQLQPGIYFISLKSKSQVLNVQKLIVQ